MALPELPPRSSYDDGYDWMGQLSNGWYEVPSWGSEGWDLGDWPYVIVAHYNGEVGDIGPFGVATYVEGDLEVKEFPTRAERDSETDRIALFYWRNRADEIPGIPTDPADNRLGPYRG